MIRIGIVVLALPLAACARASITADFEGGSLGAVQRLTRHRFVCAVEGQTDQDGRNRQASWYYFAVDGAAGTDVTITLTDLTGEYNYRPGTVCITDESPPVVSEDGISWRHLSDVAFDAERKELTFRIRPRGDRLRVAHIEPYPPSRLKVFLDHFRDHPHLRRETIGQTVERRDLELLTITNPGIVEERKRKVWLMVRQHAWESGTSFVGEGVIEWLLSETPEAKDYRDRVAFRVFPMMDPDGCAAGGVRFNRNGYDLNRNWDVDDPAKMPEIAAAKRVLKRAGKGDLFLTLHNQERGEWMSGSSVNPGRAARLFEMLKETTSFTPGAKGPRPPTKPAASGRATVYQYLEGERGVPALILEQGIARHPKLDRFPTSSDRREFGRGLARALCRVVLGD